MKAYKGNSWGLAAIGSHDGIELELLEPLINGHDEATFTAITFALSEKVLDSFIKAIDGLIENLEDEQRRSVASTNAFCTVSF